MKTATDHEFFKALADPTRLRLVCLLANQELCVCDLTEVLQIPQPTISRHMATLKQAGLVQDRRAGKWIHYILVASPPLDQLQPYFQTLRQTEPYSTDQARLTQYRRSRSC